MAQRLVPGNDTIAAMTMEVPLVRPTVRVLLLDDEDRLLLFRARDEVGRPFWFPPGGGIDDGETAQEAAMRELTEETGKSNISLGPHVWNRRHVFTWDGVTWDNRETWFLARTAAFQIDTRGFTREERSAISAHRWWSLDELRATEDLLTPRDLVSRLPDLLEGVIPVVPTEVGE